MAIEKTPTGGKLRLVLIAGLIVAAFLGAYSYAQARNATPATAGGQVAQAVAGTGQTGSAPASGGSGCACCGSTAPTANGVTGDPTEGAATDEGGVQKISIDLSKGYYEPNTIKLKAGVPAEVTFGQSSGCTGQVLSKDLNFFEDLTTGPKTVKLQGLEPGEYAFSCGMEMVFGKIVVE